MDCIVGRAESLRTRYVRNVVPLQRLADVRSTLTVVLVLSKNKQFCFSSQSLQTTSFTKVFSLSNNHILTCPTNLPAGTLTCTQCEKCTEPKGD